ncbi:MAG: hypothetical protein AB7I50_01745 [Vicinamibacterales bacterium]
MRRFVLGLVVIALVHGWCLSARIVAVRRDVYDRAAEHLVTRSGWHYGYVCAHHGCRLVRTRVGVPRPASAEPVAPSVEVWTTREALYTDVLADDDLRSQMRRELDLTPVKTAGEFALYLVILTWVCFGRRAFTKRVFGPQVSATKRRLAGAMSGMVVWLLLVSPLVFADYGEPFKRFAVSPGSTVSYDLVVLLLATPAQLLGLEFYELMSPWLAAAYFLLAGSLFYGMLGAILAPPLAGPAGHEAKCHPCEPQFAASEGARPGAGRRVSNPRPTCDDAQHRAAG